MLSNDLLALLRCPVSGQPLGLAEGALLDRVNRAIATGGVVDRGGEVVGEPLEGALVTDDGARLYRIDRGILRLLVDGAIELDQIAEP